MSGSGGVHIFWILSRGTGIAAILFASLSVTAGLLAGRGRSVKLGRFGEIKPLHEALSLATLGLIIVHGLLLIGDPWLNPGLAGIAIPFQMSYRTFWTSIGIVAGYGLTFLGLTYYLRTWIGPARWRSAHRFTALFWILGLIHTFGAGTDAGELWLQIPVAVISLPPLILLGLVLGRGGSRPSPAAKATRLA